jgi:ISXO2-like transposase domain
MTDELKTYAKLGKEFASHDVVTHSEKEYVRGTVTTNTLEGYYSIFKRGMKGVYQHLWRAFYRAVNPHRQRELSSYNTSGKPKQ